MLDLVLIVGALLLVASIIDAYTKQVPSVFLTGVILVVAIVNMAEITFGMIHLSFGIIGFIFAWLLYEADFIGGVADIKFITIIMMLCSTIPVLLIAMGLIVVFGVLYKAFWIYVLKKKKKDLVPFLPCLFWVFIALYGMGALI